MDTILCHCIRTVDSFDQGTLSHCKCRLTGSPMNLFSCWPDWYPFSAVFVYVSFPSVFWFSSASAPSHSRLLPSFLVRSIFPLFSGDLAAASERIARRVALLSASEQSLSRSGFRLRRSLSRSHQGLFLSSGGRLSFSLSLGPLEPWRRAIGCSSNFARRNG